MAFATEVPGSAREGENPEGLPDEALAHSEHRPVGEIERTGVPFEVVSPYYPGGRPARGHRGAREAGEGRGARHRAARRHRHRQVGHHGLADRAGAAPDAGDGAQQDAGRPAGQRAARAAARTTRSSTSSPTTTTTSPRRTSRRRTPTSRRTPRSTRTSSGCATRPRPTSLSPPRRRRGRLGVLHLRPGHAAVVPRPLGAAGGRRGARPRHAAARRWSTSSTPRNDMAFARGTFRVRGDTVEIIPAYEELAVRIEFFGDEIETLYYLHPLTGDVVRAGRRRAHLPGHPLRRRARAHGAGHQGHRGRAGGAPGRARAPGQAARGPAAAHAHQLRRRDDAPGRVLLRHRELLAPHRRPRAGHRAGHADRLLPARTSCWSSTSRT